MSNDTPKTPVSAKREAILDGAITCFLEHGYAATSMDSVAAEAGVSKATIYAHFSSKADLFSAVIIRRCEGGLNSDAQWPKDELDARTTLTKMGRSLLEFMTSLETLSIHRVVVAEAIRQPELASAFWDSGPCRFFPRISERFADLDRRGELKTPTPMFAAMMFVNLIKSEYFFCRLLGLPKGTELMSADETVETAVNVMLKAYAPD